MTALEKWLPIPSCPGYEASSFGRIKSFVRYASGKIIAPCSHPKGYLYVSLRVGGKSVSKKVHRLVLEAFVGPCPDGHESAHEDGSKDNNRADNLSWKTAKLNTFDKFIHKTMPSKILDSTAIAIKMAVKNGYKQSEVARMYSLSRGNVCLIVNGKSWGHIS